MSWIYFWSAAASLLFLFLDGTIRRTILKEKMKTANVKNYKNMAVEIRRQLHQLEQDKKKHIISEEDYKELKRDLSNQLKNLMKY